MRKRILLSNAGMRYKGGTQAWVQQMHAVLSRNHDVDIFSLDGFTGGLPPFDPGLRYDIGLLNHWTTAQALREARIGIRIHTCHGVLPFEEIPVLGADAYVSVSEAVQAWVPFPSTVIRNPIDTVHFAPAPTSSRRLKRVAFVSNRQGAARPILEEACEHIGAELRVVGKETAVEDPLEVYQWADVVVGIARVAMEALAVERNVLCFDYQGFHGMATEERLQGLRRSNFGGHEAGTWPTGEQVAAILCEEYDPLRTLRHHIQTENAPEQVAAAYLQLADAGGACRVAAAVRRGPRQLMSPKITQLVQHGRAHLRAATG